MKHESLKVKDITIKATPSFRIRVEAWNILRPTDMCAFNIIQECINDKGEITTASTYNFHMNKNEIQRLCEGLMSV